MPGGAFDKMALATLLLDEIKSVTSGTFRSALMSKYESRASKSSSTLRKALMSKLDTRAGYKTFNDVYKSIDK